ncbi:hypothetical protein Tco_0260925 [Tanacetum coccineum]
MNRPSNFKHYFWRGRTSNGYLGSSKPSPRLNELGTGSSFSDINKLLLRRMAPSMLIVVILCRLSRIFEASRARGFVLRSQELQILSFIWEIQYPNLID